jgi:hypothetical protein
MNQTSRRLIIALLGALVAGMIGTTALAQCNCVGEDCYSDIVVTDAGIDASLGTYIYDGLVGGKPSWEHERFGVRIFYSQTELCWKIGNSDEEYYYQSGLTTADSPPASRWNFGPDGDLPMPKVTSSGPCEAAGLVVTIIGDDRRIREWTDEFVPVDISFATAPTSDVTITITPDSQLDIGQGASVQLVISYQAGVDPWDDVHSFEIHAVDDATLEDGEMTAGSFDVEPWHTGKVRIETESADPEYNAHLKTLYIQVEDERWEIVVEQTPPLIVLPEEFNENTFMQWWLISLAGQNKTFVSEAGDQDTILVSLSTEPSEKIDVFVYSDYLTLYVDSNRKLPPLRLTFDKTNWNVPQEVVFGMEDNAYAGTDLYSIATLHIDASYDSPTHEFADAKVELPVFMEDDEYWKAKENRFGLNSFLDQQYPVWWGAARIAAVYKIGDRIRASYEPPLRDDGSPSIGMTATFDQVPKSSYEESLFRAGLTGTAPSDSSGFLRTEVGYYDENTKTHRIGLDTAGLDPGIYLLQIDYTEDNGDDYTEILYILIVDAREDGNPSQTLEDYEIVFTMGDKLKELLESDD